MAGSAGWRQVRSGGGSPVRHQGMASGRSRGDEMSIGERSSPADARDALAPVEGSVEATEVGGDGVPRRRFLTWLAAAPTITMIAHVGLDVASPALAGAATGTIDAAAAQLPGGLDLGDAL